MDERQDLIARIGTFFLLVGIGMIILFIASDVAKGTNFGYFIFGLFSMGLGGYFKRISAPPKKSAGRFEGWRKYQQKRREAQEKKAAPKKK